MKESLRSKLTQLSARLEEIEVLLSGPEVTADMKNYRRLTLEHAELMPIVDLHKNFVKYEKDVESAQELALDPEMKELADQEINQGRMEMERLEKELQKELLPKDPNDEKSVYLEIRAGTGGDESALFAADLLRMYIKYAELQGWSVEIVSESASGLGGYKEVIVKLVGKRVYSRLKFESGGHRVQRVPETETQGRIHTSACTIAIMPEVDEVEDVDLNSAELRIDTYRASGAGGQHVNKTDSAVRITHLPTGIVVECQDDRSQHKNRAQAMSILAAKIKSERVRELEKQEAATRKTLVGSGDRSERIRTYNFPQGRLTDHRINLTLYKLSQIMDGDLEELLGVLTSEHQAQQLAELSTNDVKD